MRVFIGLVAAMVSLAPALARAESCTCSNETFSAASITTAAGWDGCTPSADDSFTIGSGCNVTLTDDWIWDGATASTGMTVQSGGSLTVGVGSDSNRLRVSMNANGINCQPGSTCTLNGQFRKLDAGVSSKATSLSTTPDRWYAGTVQLCDGDCATTPERVCFQWTDANDNAPAPGFGGETDTGDMGWDNSLAQIAVAGANPTTTGAEDLIKFWDFDKTDVEAGADDNNVYHIVTVDSTGPDYELCFSVDQTRNDAGATYTTTERGIRLTTLAADVPAGGGCGFYLDPTAASGSSLQMPDCGGSAIRLTAATSPITADGQYVGRFLQIEKGTTGAPYDQPYKIVQTIDCAGAPASPDPCAGSADDIAVIANLEGLHYAAPSGNDVWITYGHRKGDTFMVMVPVQLDSATAAGDDSDVVLAGTHDVYSVLLTNGSNTPGITSGDVDAANNVGTLTRWEHVVVRSPQTTPTPNTGKGFVIMSRTDGATYGSTAIYGQGHGYLLETNNLDTVNPNVVIEDFAIRYGGDCCGAAEDNTNTPQGVARRVWCQFQQRVVSTGSVLSSEFFSYQGSNTGGLKWVDSGCEACVGSDEDGAWAMSSDGDLGTGLDVDGFAAIGIAASLLTTVAPSDRHKLRNVALIGINSIASGGGNPSVCTYCDVEASSFRWIDMASTGTGQVFLNIKRLANTLVRGVRSAATVGMNTTISSARVENVGLIDFLGGTDSVIEESSINETGMLYDRVTIAYSTGFSSAMAATRGIDIRGTASPLAYWKNVALVNLDAAGIVNAFDDLSTSTPENVLQGNGRYCFYNNDNDHISNATVRQCLAGTRAECSTNRVSKGVPLGYLDEERGVFIPVRSGRADEMGCGFGASPIPGITRRRYMHSRLVLDHQIELLMGARSGGGGGGRGPRAY
jgi:hypothetical protein